MLTSFLLAISPLASLAAAPQGSHFFEPEPAITTLQLRGNSPTHGPITGLNGSPISLDGILEIFLNPGSGPPWTEGQFESARLYTIPNEILAIVEDPGGGPPLVSITIRDLSLSLSSDPFDIEPTNGEYQDVDVEVEFVHGTAIIDEPGIGITQIPLAGHPTHSSWVTEATIDMFSPPNIGFELPLELYVPLNTGTFVGDLILDGTLNSSHDLNFPPAVLEISPIHAGQTASVQVSGAIPNQSFWLGSSLLGPGSTFVPSLGVFSDILLPNNLIGPLTTDSSGNLTIQYSVPLSSQGTTVWLQGGQVGFKTHALVVTVQ